MALWQPRHQEQQQSTTRRAQQPQQQPQPQYRQPLPRSQLQPEPPSILLPGPPRPEAQVYRPTPMVLQQQTPQWALEQKAPAAAGAPDAGGQLQGEEQDAHKRRASF